MKNKKLVWGIVIVVVIIIVLKLWYGYMVKHPIITTPTPTAQDTVTPSPTPTPTPVKTTPIITKTPAPVTSLKSYSDNELRLTLSYPSDWELNKSDAGPNYGFFLAHKVLANEASIFRIGKTDGCRLDTEITVSGMKAYDSGWRSVAHPTRTVCIVDKKYLITFTAQDEGARLAENAMLASLVVAK